jgi:hypothetical protein
MHCGHDPAVTARDAALLGLLHTGRTGNVESRVLAGFHFRFATDAGIKVGRKIGQFASSP